MNTSLNTDPGGQKVAFITGGSGGLGLATARTLVENGWRVYAADCNKKGLESLKHEHGLIPIFIDVTDSKSVQAAFDAVKQDINHIDAVINFAGILRVGSMAEMSEETLQLLLDINVMGTFRVNKIFLPLLNSEHSKGRIVNISSETGWQSGGPFNGAYAMSKHAIEGYSDSLRRELMFLGVPVIKIQPGPFKTDMVASIESNFNKAESESHYFKKQLARVTSLALKEQFKANDPKMLAAVILDALTVDKPKSAYSVKPDISRYILEFLPAAWADALMKKVIA